MKAFVLSLGDELSQPGRIAIAKAVVLNGSLNYLSIGRFVLDVTKKETLLASTGLTSSDASIVGAFLQRPETAWRSIEYVSV